MKRSKGVRDGRRSSFEKRFKNGEENFLKHERKHQKGINRDGQWTDFEDRFTSENQMSLKEKEKYNGSTRSLEKPSEEVLGLIDQSSERKWYDAWKFFNSNTTKEAKAFSCVKEAIEFLKKDGEACQMALRSYLERIENKVDKEKRWLNKVVLHGTLRDKIASRTLLIQQCPFIRLDELQWLIEQIGNVNRSGSSLAADAIKDLMVNDLLPSTRKLYFIADNSFFLSSITTTDIPTFSKKKKTQLNGSKEGTTDIMPIRLAYSSVGSLMLWFEDKLKSCYIFFILALQKGCRDTQDFIRHRCLKLVYELLAHSPEQEQSLMSLLICSLMDSRHRRKDSMIASYFLQELLKQHTEMIQIVSRYIVRELYEKISTWNAFNHEGIVLYSGVNFLVRLRSKLYSKEDAENVLTALILLLKKIFESCSTLAQSKKKRSLQKKLKRKRKILLQAGILDSKTSQQPVLAKRPSYKLLRVVLDGISRLLPSAPESFVADINIPQDILHNMFEVIDTGAAKLSLLLFWARLNQLLSQEYGALYKTFFKNLLKSDLIQASNNMIILKLLASIEDNDHSISLLPLVFGRRCLQVTCHILQPYIQIKVLEYLFSFISKHFLQTAPLLLFSEQSLMVEIQDTFQDAPREAWNGNEEETKDQKDPVFFLPKNLKRSNPFSNDPYSEWRHQTHLWEAALLQASVHPSIAHYTRLMYAWALHCRNAKQDWNSSTTDFFHHVSLSRIFPSSILDSRGSSHALTYVMSSGFVLELLAERFVKRKHGKRKTEKKDNPSVYSSDFWKTKKQVYPHEYFMHKYFTDPFVVEQYRKRQQSNKCHADMENEVICTDMCPEDNSEDEFFDRLMAQETNAQDGFSDEGFDGDDAPQSDIFSEYEMSMDSDHLEYHGSDVSDAVQFSLEVADNSSRWKDSMKKNSENVFADASNFKKYLK